jgi:hypothetical protein
MAEPLAPAQLEAWGAAGSALLVDIAARGLVLAGGSLDAGAPHGPGPQWLALRRAVLGVNLEFLQDAQHRLFWFFRGRRDADAPGHLVARARIGFTLAPRFAAAAAVPAAPAITRLLPALLALLPAADRVRLFGRPDCLVFAADGQPILAHAPAAGWLLPGGRATGASLPLGPGLALMSALAATRPSLTRSPAGTHAARGGGPLLAERAAAVIAATHLAAESGMVALAGPAMALLPGYTLAATQAVIECALTDGGATPDADALAGALRMALSVAIAPDPAGGRIGIRLALGPPDVLADGPVFAAFAAAIAGAAREAAFAVAAGVPQAVLRQRDRARLVMRFGAARNGFDRDLVAWQTEAGDFALFTVAARVSGGNLAPSVDLADPAAVQGAALPRPVAARLAAIADVLRAWAGAA